MRRLSTWCLHHWTGCRLACVALTLGAIALAAPVGPAGADATSSWRSGGHDISDSHSNPAEHTINPDNVSQLGVKWTYTTHGDVSATPAVVDGAAYFPDWGGYLDKVDIKTGTQIWSEPISGYDGVPGSVSRTSPAVVGGRVYIGDQNGGHLSAVNARTGKLIWTTQLDSHPAAILTGGAIVHNGVVYQGVASLEEAFAATA